MKNQMVNLHHSLALGMMGSQLFNNLLAIIIAVATVDVFIKYHWKESVDPFKCDALLQAGQWLDQPEPGLDTIPEIWQPPGCTIHKYKSRDIAGCLKNKSLLFVGDSTIRQVFWATACGLDPSFSFSDSDKHSDQIVTRFGVKLQFIWDPWLNSSILSTELEKFAGSMQRPAVLLVGAGLWYSKYIVDPNSLLLWKYSVNDIIHRIKQANIKFARPHSDLLLLAPIVVPAWEKLSGVNNQTILPEEVDAMNTYLKELTRGQGINVFWAFNGFTKGLSQTFDQSGIHNVKEIATMKANTLLNLRCNPERKEFPFDGTCCSPYKAPNPFQWLALIGTLFAFPIISMILNAPMTSGKLKSFLPSRQNHAALTAFGLAVVFCFYADRTQVLSKSHKFFVNSEFYGMLGATVLLGTFTTRKVSADPRIAETRFFLNRNQTDEWKGWMQFIILIYHYTGASKITLVYEIVRLFVASYLFMTGYGHTLFFYKKQDFTFKRVSTVLIRLNMLSLVLPFMMTTNYLFYYFAPLVSYWFIVVYFTMWVGHKFNVNTGFLISKIAVSAVVTTGFTMMPGLLERVFGILESIAAVKWDVDEWRFRVILDMWIVYFGMLVAVAFVKGSDTFLNSSFSRTAVLFSAIALPSYIYFQSTFPNKYAYNEVHRYISFIPIIAFIILRNATHTLRRTYVSAYAWLGNCSLETFTLQFHIWMAADTRALLEYGIFGFEARRANFFISTFIFLYTSKKVSSATEKLTSWIVDPECEGKDGAKAVEAQMLVLPSSMLNLQMEILKSHTSAETHHIIGGGTKVFFKLGAWLLIMWLLNLVTK